MRKEQEEFLMRFMDDFDDPIKNPRMAKCQSLYYLAITADRPIVELGTYHGCGAIALGFGAKDGNKVPIYTVDDYQLRTGWAGESYEPEDERAFWTNMVDVAADFLVKPNLIAKTTQQAAQDWQGLISLIFWDTGSEDLEEDFLAWAPHLKPGGIFAVHDTQDRQFGSDEVFGEGWLILPELPGMIYCASLLDS